MSDGIRHRDLAAPFDRAALDALRGDLAGTRGLPAAYREALLDELALLLDASRRHLAHVRPRGALTRRGVPLAALRAYERRQPRIERVLRLLGLLDVAPETKPSIDELIARARVRPQEGQ